MIMTDKSVSEESLLNVVQYPALVVKDGNIIAFNNRADRAFHLTSTGQTEITGIWPEYCFRKITRIERIHLPEDNGPAFAVVKTRKLQEKEVLVTFRVGDVQPRTMEPDTGYGSPSWLTEKLNLLVGILKELNSFENLNDIYRNFVILTREKLDIDRISILLLNKQKGTYYGTWGTDEKGNLSDESDFEAAIEHSGWMGETFGNQVYSLFQEDIPLWLWGKQVGRGWSAMVNLWQGEEIIGWIAADNLLSRLPLTPSVKELFRQLGASLSQLISYKEAENSRRKQHQKLEELVTEKTEELEKQYETLILVNRRLTEQESLRSMGESVAGVAHELNTPIGVCVTAASHLVDYSGNMEKLFESKDLSETELREFFNSVTEIGRIISLNISEAARLVKTFKETSINQISDHLVDFSLKDLIETVILSQRYRWKKKDITFELGVPEKMVIHSYPGLIIQVISNLINNSLIHGFNETESGRIKLEAEYKDRTVNLRFSDNGCGVPEELHRKIFESFYTTGRSTGSSGLGLYLVRDIVENQLNGSLLFESTPGKGTLFTITIPG